MATIADLKKKLQSQKIDDLSTKGSSNSSKEKDETYWFPTFDKEKGTGYAEIRFLPAHQDEIMPYVKILSYEFKGPTGKWYIEKSPTMLGGKDPVFEMNGRLYASGIESDKAEASKYKRKQKFVSNVYVIDDKGNPENNGKVFKYKYGPKIHSFIENAMKPPAEFADEEPFIPFDPYTGANFVIKMVGVTIGKDIVPNYDKSYFKQVSPLFKDDEKLMEVWNKVYPLKPLIDKDTQFKTYDELKNKLFEVLGPEIGSGIPTVIYSNSPSEPVKKEQNKKEERKETVIEKTLEVKEDSSSFDDEYEKLFND